MKQSSFIFGGVTLAVFAIGALVFILNTAKPVSGAPVADQEASRQRAD